MSDVAHPGRRKESRCARSCACGTSSPKRDSPIRPQSSRDSLWLKTSQAGWTKRPAKAAPQSEDHGGQRDRCIKTALLTQREPGRVAVAEACGRLPPPSSPSHFWRPKRAPRSLSRILMPDRTGFSVFSSSHACAFSRDAILFALSSHSSSTCLPMHHDTGIQSALY